MVILNKFVLEGGERKKKKLILSQNMQINPLVFQLSYNYVSSTLRLGKLLVFTTHDPKFKIR